MGDQIVSINGVVVGSHIEACDQIVRADDGVIRLHIRKLAEVDRRLVPRGSPSLHHGPNCLVALDSP